MLNRLVHNRGYFRKNVNNITSIDYLGVKINKQIFLFTQATKQPQSNENR